jgi:hypothetical protein
VGGFTTTFTTVTSNGGGTVTASDNSGNTVTIKNITAALAAANNGANNNAVTYSINADAAFSSTNAVSTNSNISVSFTLQAIGTSGLPLYSTTATGVSIPLGEQTQVLYSGTLPTTVSGNLPNAINGYTITTTNYWNSLISYWQIAPGSLTVQ